MQILPPSSEQSSFRWGLFMKWWLWNGQEAIFLKSYSGHPFGLLRAEAVHASWTHVYRLFKGSKLSLLSRRSMGRMLSLSLWEHWNYQNESGARLPSWDPSFTVLTIGCRVILHEDLNSDNCVEMSIIWILHTFQRLIIRGLTHA